MGEDVFAPDQAQMFSPQDDVIQSDMESRSAPTSAKLVKAGHAHHFTRRMHPWALAQQIASGHIGPEYGIQNDAEHCFSNMDKDAL
jgi:hypothetical protein